MDNKDDSKVITESLKNIYIKGIKMIKYHFNCKIYFPV